MSGADGIPGIMAAVTDTRHPLTDVALASVTTDADTLYAAFADWVGGLEITPYPHQDEAIIEVLSGQHVVLATPTGSGKSLVATASHFAALAGDRVSFYTAPIKALVNEKFFALCEVFGADQVGLLTGDASVNSNAPIICCTAEVLANIALREGTDADVGLVVMDDVVVDSVLEVSRRIAAEEPARVGLVLAEQRHVLPRAPQLVPSEERVLGLHRAIVPPQPGPPIVATP